MTQITSSDLIPIEEHFRVAAGPGAGKTHFLTHHIKNVLKTSSRMGRTRRVACITYTNIAVETLLSRLGSVSERVEASTIHSFLYKHIVKPYVSKIAVEFDLNVARLDGHDAPFVNFLKVKDWLKTPALADQLRVPYTYAQLTRRQDIVVALKRWLLTIDYSLDAAQELTTTTKRQDAYYFDNNGGRQNLSAACLNTLERFLVEYKKLYWADGILHHNDVLFFSFKLLQRFPFILDTLRAKFPYFFIDEFQDTNEIQSEIVNRIGRAETIVGIVGDTAQSIYEFQGARPENFKTFELPNLRDYSISANRRSTGKIVAVLNAVRDDFEQDAARGNDGEQPMLMVGSKDEALERARVFCDGEPLQILARKNATATSLRNDLDGEVFNLKLIDDFNLVDSNGPRRRAITRCMEACEFATAGRYKEALREMEWVHKQITDKQLRRWAALESLKKLVNNLIVSKGGSLLDFHAFVGENIWNEIAGLREGGQIYEFYRNTTYRAMAVCVAVVDEQSLSRTIHKSKGDEFDNLLVVFSKNNELDFLLTPEMNKEEHRLRYVAISRAKNRLFLNVPAPVVGENYKRINDLGFRIEELPGSL